MKMGLKALAVAMAFWQIAPAYACDDLGLLTIRDFAIPEGYRGIFKVAIDMQTGEDNLRGGNDNAFVRLDFQDPALGASSVSAQINRGNVELPNCSFQSVVIDPPTQGFTLASLRSFTVYVEGFTGGIGGDNWNVDSIQITVYYVDPTGLAREQVVFGARQTPLVRFTGQLHSFTRNLN